MSVAEICVHSIVVFLPKGKRRYDFLSLGYLQDSEYPSQALSSLLDVCVAFALGQPEWRPALARCLFARNTTSPLH
jgi:hypothetical protein